MISFIASFFWFIDPNAWLYLIMWKKLSVWLYFLQSQQTQSTILEDLTKIIKKRVRVLSMIL